jgi:hypothetical protein
MNREYINWQHGRFKELVGPVQNERHSLLYFLKKRPNILY